MAQQTSRRALVQTSSKGSVSGRRTGSDARTTCDLVGVGAEVAVLAELEREAEERRKQERDRLAALYTAAKRRHEEATQRLAARQSLHPSVEELVRAIVERISVRTITIAVTAEQITAAYAPPAPTGPKTAQMPLIDPHDMRRFRFRFGVVTGTGVIAALEAARAGMAVRGVVSIHGALKPGSQQDDRPLAARVLVRSRRTGPDVDTFRAGRVAIRCDRAGRRRPPSPSRSHRECPERRRRSDTRVRPRPRSARRRAGRSAPAACGSA